MGRNIIIFAFFLLVLAIAACQQNSAETKLPNAKPTQTTNTKPTETATAAPTITPNTSEIKTFKSKGVVTKINLELVSVELNHEKIEDLMPAMIMEFYVKEKSELEVLKLGDKVAFVLEDNRGQERIISIKKIQ